MVGSKLINLSKRGPRSEQISRDEQIFPYNVVFVFLYSYMAWTISQTFVSLQWHHNGRDGVSNHQPHDCLLNLLFKRKSKKTSKLRVTGLCVGNSPVTGEFPAQMTSNAENVSIWWRHHVTISMRSGNYSIVSMNASKLRDKNLYPG